MIIDSIDIEIIKIFYFLKSGETTNTYSITKKIFPKQINSKYTVVLNRLKKLKKYGIIKIYEGEYFVYELQMEKVNFKKIKFKNSYKNAICLLIDSEWSAFEY